MSTDATGEVPCSKRLHREAINCLETFPSKIVEFNEIVEEYVPESVKNDKCYNNSRPRTSRCQSTLSTVRDYDFSTVPDLDVNSYYSLSLCDRNRPHHGICKRRYYRTRGFTGSTIRRRPGPLGQLLAFIIGRLTFCTKKIVIDPSQYIIDSVFSLLFQRRRLKNVQCGPSSKWKSSRSAYVMTQKKDASTIGELIDIMRSAMIQLIDHTTILKRWLQTVTSASKGIPETELSNAIRITETIDCWAYELFFHLKYLQVNRARLIRKENERDTKESDEMIHVNLWHRMVQLRDNYIILYETLHNNEKIHDLHSKPK